MKHTTPMPILLAALAALACQPAAGGPAGRDPAVVDSIRPIQEEIERFRATLGREPAGLTGGAGSIDSLVSELVEAVNARRAEPFARLAVDRREFAYFYYPFTPYTMPPYELSPALVWYRHASRSSRGLTRLLATFESRPMRWTRSTCRVSAPAGEGILHECSISVLDAEGALVEVRVFGRILELHGRFKFLSYANEL